MFVLRMRPKKKKRTITKKLVIFVGGLFLVCLTFLAAATAFFLKDLPRPETITKRALTESTKIYDRTGKILLYEVYKEEKRTQIALDMIPLPAQQALIAIEDANFYNHFGLDWRGVARAVIENFTPFGPGFFRGSGGSTITQQLVKNSLVGTKRTYARKLKEAILAILLERQYSKSQILEWYLNQIPFGSNAYGIESAAQTFFGKNAESLTISESALLAALPKAPTYYSPYGQHKDELLNRKNLILNRMQELGFLSPDEIANTKKEVPVFLPPRKDIIAPHFVMMVREELARRFGEEEVERGGLNVTTTLDVTLQTEAEKIIGEGAEYNTKTFNATNAGLIAIDPVNGNILALVGSKNYFDVAAEGNFNVTTAFRQPGSAFKPFVYATAFKKGYTPDTVVFDTETEFNPLCNPDGTPGPLIQDPKDCYKPQNYDGSFRGPVTLRRALAQSLNVPAVKVLYLAGVQDSVATARDLGITTLGDGSRFGLSLVLGGAEVKLLEMTSAFGVFAREGVRVAPTPILRIEHQGRPLWEFHPEPRPVLDTNIARLINDVLSDNAARIGVFHPNSSLAFQNRDVAAKTGTTQEFRDAWTVGYVPSLAVGVWVGNNDNTPIQEKGGGITTAAPLWRRFMDVALASVPPEAFTAPEIPHPEKAILRGVWRGEEIVKLDRVSGKRATDATPPDFIEEHAYGEPHTILWWLNPKDPAGPKPEYPEEDPQYKNWNASFRKWLLQSGFVPIPVTAIPEAYDDAHTAEKSPKIEVVSFTEEKIITRISGFFPLKEVIFFIDDAPYKTIVSPAEGQIEFLFPALIKEEHTFRIKTYDAVGNSGEWESGL
ncbi:MAG: transglycosylase domain-containing protein [bacterium]|nr:transglycosylase domain-containing protein [bacterium]